MCGPCQFSGVEAQRQPSGVTPVVWVESGLFSISFIPSEVQLLKSDEFQTEARS